MKRIEIIINFTDIANLTNDDLSLLRNIIIEEYAGIFLVEENDLSADISQGPLTEKPADIQLMIPIDDSTEAAKASFESLAKAVLMRCKELFAEYPDFQGVISVNDFTYQMTDQMNKETYSFDNSVLRNLILVAALSKAGIKAFQNNCVITEYVSLSDFVKIIKK